MAQLPVHNVEAGSSAYFYCNGPRDIRWYKQQQDNVVEITGGGRFDVSFVLSDGVSYANMTINNVVRDDSGVYTCRDNQNSFDVFLTVYEGKEHATAFTIQQSLLSRRLPYQSLEGCNFQYSVVSRLLKVITQR